MPYFTRARGLKIAHNQMPIDALLLMHDLRIKHFLIGLIGMYGEYSMPCALFYLFFCGMHVVLEFSGMGTYSFGKIDIFQKN